MSEIAPEVRDAFLKDLTAISKKHGIVIHGCGCCSSPWLAVAECVSRRYEVDAHGGNLEFNEPDTTIDGNLAPTSIGGPDNG